MPTVLKLRGYRIFFYSADGDEPPHVHVYKDGKELKIWLRSSEIAINKGFSLREAEIVRKIVSDHTESLMDAWNDYFRS